ncbi:MAG TPA: M12 family metallopeptidase [Longimicrobium sp.]|nr:M12 family metallopeptidase [Longimicrobium sp.]
MRFTRYSAGAILCALLLTACQEHTSIVSPTEGPEPSGILDPAKGPAHTGYILGSDGKTPLKIQYQVVNGHAIHDGDIGIGPAATVAKTAAEVLRARSGDRPAYSLHYNGASYWGDTNGVIPVRRVYAPTNLDAALSQIEAQVPGVDFVAYTGQYHHLVIYYGSGSNYYNGCYNGRCEVYIGGSTASKALIMHEVGHALGFQHEIKRCDRNSFIRMLDTSYDPSQFSIDCNRVRIGGYDLNSIMHYNSREFGARHFTDLNGLDVNGYWGRTTLSSGDVAAWRSLYPGGTSTGFAARTANTGAYTGPYNLRTGPGTGFALAGSIAGGAAVTIVCQTTGTSHEGPWGITNIWDKLGGAEAGKFISDAFVHTGHDGFIPGVPRC